MCASVVSSGFDRNFIKPDFVHATEWSPNASIVDLHVLPLHVVRANGIGHRNRVLNAVVNRLGRKT